MKIIALAAILSIASLSTPAYAQPDLRRIESSPTSSWKHSHTGMIIPPRLGKTTRATIQDSSQNQYDIWIDFLDAEEDLYSNIFIYRAAIPDVSIWFDRAQKVIEAREIYRFEGQIADPLITTFAAPNSSAPNALRAAYAVPEAAMFRSTAVAILPLNGWIVKFRLSSRSLSREELDQTLAQAISELRWPKQRAPSASVRLMIDCPDPVDYQQANPLPTHLKHVLGDTVLGDLGTLFAADRRTIEQDVEKADYCREKAQHSHWGHYRSESDPDSYLLALNDAGRSIDVRPTKIQKEGIKRYVVTLLGVENSSHHSHFDGLPTPQQAADLVNKETPLATTTADLRTIINTSLRDEEKD